ncbi:hypothetical protein HanHA300_Chr02g0051721 [Helianthus annuus]|nr:hypothetical protein HanHA300_Chr02g0051721 [Helianthus annuus]
MMFLSLPMLPFLPEMPLTGRLIITPPLHVQRTIPSDWPVSVQELDRSTPAEYLDLGSCTKACEYCQTLFWYDERLVSSLVILGPKYNKCCSMSKMW